MILNSTTAKFGDQILTLYSDKLTKLHINKSFTWQLFTIKKYRWRKVLLGSWQRSALWRGPSWWRRGRHRGGDCWATSWWRRRLWGVSPGGRGTGGEPWRRKWHWKVLWLGDRWQSETSTCRAGDSDTWVTCNTVVVCETCMDDIV